MKLIECPRDAMQGLDHFVPTDLKIQYLNTLLQVGFDTLDFGSFVSPKAIPQMRDTAEVLAGLDLTSTSTKLLAIVANRRGAEQAVAYPQIQYIGFPLSVSETFQQRNTNKSIAQAFIEVADMQSLCVESGKQLVVYLSMGFGNPYGDSYSPAIVSDFTEKLLQLGVGIIAPSDTIGSSTPEAIEMLFRHLIQTFPSVEFGAHLHARPGEAGAKIRAAIRAGVNRIDGALRGFGGCPMAADALTGNLPTEEIIQTLLDEEIALSINQSALQKALMVSSAVF
ncbi:MULTISPECIES: hydroxymethylglutaryl-CoA lyase [unclassified Spirosoma]|uniref:hydroxymethylglutaryl-CoA lyase n=1 Tax=unclassified Spirosoma TaxID=2621999 RepID=UPI00095A3161|nr:MULTISPECIES: hydroxymethylglutaryl-CoA lyase [unclassified Spirosoma]MBN8823696.1 hydroxymethylglutaryl-CoA lyase [Spirosoma sp.]OJW76754.1 MAG: hydroxymethylglutaryl-CoA lyase [Spirosoma sp. 48-14]